jgi:hypothetical protein
MINLYLNMQVFKSTLRTSEFASLAVWIYIVTFVVVVVVVAAVVVWSKF